MPCVRCLFTIAGICVWLFGSAQKVAGEQAIIMQALLDSAQYYELIAPTHSLSFARTVLNAVPVEDNEVMYVRALLHAANSEKMLSNKEEALDLCRGAIEIANAVQHPELQIRSYFMLASVFGQYDDTDSSLVNYQKVIELHHPELGWYPISSSYFIAAAYSAIGRTYRQLGQPQKAEEYLIKGYTISHGNEFGHMEALTELITLYSEQDDPKYLSYLDTLAMSKFYQDASPTSFLAHFDSFLKLEGASDERKEEKLREVYQHSLTNSSQVNQVGYGLKLFEHLDRLHRDAEAHELLLELLQTANIAQHGKHMAIVTYALYENSKKQGHLQEALGYLERHGAIQDSLMGVENMQRINELNVKFETAQKDNEIAQQRIRLEQARRNRNFLMILALLIGLLAVVTFVYFRNRARALKKISEQDKIIHAQEKEHLLKEKEVAELTASLETQERERNRIARDLHDGLGSLMSGISAQIETLRAKPTFEGNGSPNLSQLRDMVKEATAELRRTSYELMPASLLRQGLEPAIRDLCVNLLVKNGIVPTLEINADLTTLNHEQQLTIYRILQELLNNIVKHAAAHNVLIQFNQYDGEYSLIVEDDGSGFDVKQKQQTGGLGLGSLQSRVNLIKGFLDIASLPGQGTTVTVNFKMAEGQKG